MPVYFKIFSLNTDTRGDISATFYQDEPFYKLLEKAELPQLYKKTWTFTEVKLCSKLHTKESYYRNCAGQRVLSVPDVAVQNTALSQADNYFNANNADYRHR